MSCHDLVSWKRQAADHAEATPADDGSRLAIGETVSVSGRWTLCWIHGSPLNGPADPMQRVNVVLRELVGPHSADERRFFPVFPKSDSSQDIDKAMSELQAQHPQLVAPSWLVDDLDAGLTTAKAQ
jgi:hypothetical protein